MAKHDDEVKVHVTYFGGMYVDPSELLRSTAAGETMLKMSRILREERGRQVAESVVPSAQGASRGQ